LKYKIITKLLINKELIIIENNNKYIIYNLVKGLDYIIKAFNNKEPDFYIYKNYIIFLLSFRTSSLLFSFYIYSSSLLELEY
jgi:hypothetical protein